MTNTTARLRALRHSHCDTCSCNRCKWIDANPASFDDQEHSLQDDEIWLVEGVLTIHENGAIALQHGGQITPLADTLAGRLGHHIVVLVGGMKQYESNN